MNQQAIRLCALNATKILEKCFNFYFEQILTWKCCRCEPPSDEIVEKKGDTRRCYNKNCGCYKHNKKTGEQIPCFNCECAEWCQNTPGLIPKREEDKVRKQKKSQDKPKKGTSKAQTPKRN